jgi:hypothetical protein
MIPFSCTQQRRFPIHGALLKYTQLGLQLIFLRASGLFGVVAL